MGVLGADGGRRGTYVPLHDVRGASMNMHIITCLNCGESKPRINMHRYTQPGPSHYTCSSDCRDMVEFGTTDTPRTEPGNLNLTPAFARYG